MNLRASQQQYNQENPSKTSDTKLNKFWLI